MKKHVVFVLLMAVLGLFPACSGSETTRKSPPPQPAPSPAPDGGYEPAPVWPPEENKPAPKPEPAPAPRPAPKPEPKPVPVPQPDVQPKPAPQDPLKAETGKILDLVNGVRKNKLRADNNLTSMAVAYAGAMGRAGQLTHSLNGQDLGKRLTQIHYSFSAAGENIAMGQPDGQAVFNAWMNSPGHKANILAAEFIATGVGAFKDTKGRMWWVQVFARQTVGDSFSAGREPKITCPGGLVDPSVED